MTVDPDPEPRRYIAPPNPPMLNEIPPFLPDPSDLPPVQYTVQLSTANAKWAGTDKDVFLQLYGDLYTTHFIHLSEASHADMQTSLRYSTPDNFPAATSRTDFPIGSIREFRFKASPVGNLVKICIRHDSSADSSAAWKLERVVIRNEELQRSWTFLCSRWLNRDMGNQVELKPGREVSAGRRASRRASRRLSSSKHSRLSYAAEGTIGSDRFEIMRDRFGSHELQSADGSLSKGSETGTRRVCFQLQKFTNKSCHVYLLGEIPALGSWRPERALRMTMHSAADGTWRGEWRLELEIDDDYDDIQYTYMIVNESDSKHNRRVDTPDRLRRFRLSAPDSLGRTTEGGRIHIRDSFGANKFGLPSASPGSPSLVLRKAASRTASIQTPRGEARLMSQGVIPTVSTIEPEEQEKDAIKWNIRSALENLNEDDNETVQSANVLKNGSAIIDANNGCETGAVEGNILGGSSGSLDANVFSEEKKERDIGESTDGQLEENEGAVRARNVEEDSGSPKDEIQRDGAVARREWEEQLDASDGQLFKSAQRLLQRQSEVAFLKKRNSRDVSGSPMLLSPHPQSPEKTSPVSSDGIYEDESFVNGHTKQAVIELTHSEIRKPLIEEKNRLLSEVERLQIEARQREDRYSQVIAIHHSLQEELVGMKDKMSEQCELYEAQQAELVRLVMDEQETYRVSRQKLEAQRDMYEQRWAREFKARRKLFNTIQELRGNIRVFCRVRPPKEPYIGADSEGAIAVGFPDAALGENARIQLSHKLFEFDHVFQPSSTQKAVYDETAGVVASVLDGYNVCVFAYGQTGSGKTHTMNGPNNDRGVNYRALVDLFDIAAQRAEFTDVRITVSMLEIYNEQLRDLIRNDCGSNPQKLEIRKDPSSSSSNAVYVPNLTEVEVDSVESVWDVMEQGSANRKKGKTNMNEHSSRSHLILRVSVSIEDFSSGVKSSGVLHLVDLAGSERVGRSNVSGERLKEAQHINKSLATLGDVFMSLLSQSGHVPYRNSKLTYLLQDCLGGDSKTLMFVNVSADDSDAAETLSSLQFAQRVAKIELGSARKHTESTAQTKAVASLQSKEKELQELSSKVSGLQREIRRRNEAAEESAKRVKSLEAELKNAKLRFEEQRRREAIGREGSTAELKGLQAQLEKGQAEIRAARQKMKDATLAKDDEINRLNAMLKAKEKKIVELSRQSGRQAEKPPSGPANRLNRPASTPVVSARKPERTPLSRLPRNSATFTARSRQVRFESPTGEGGESEKAKDDTALPSTSTPAGAARRAAARSLVRNQAATAPRPQRQATRGAGGAGTGKTVTYAFGTRIASKEAENGPGSKPARNVRLPRAQTTLRPAQRVSQPQNGKVAQSGLSGPRRTGSGLRRAGTFAGVHRTPSEDLEK